MGSISFKDQWEVKMNYLIVLAEVMRNLIQTEEY